MTHIQARQAFMCVCVCVFLFFKFFFPTFGVLVHELLLQTESWKIEKVNEGGNVQQSFLCLAGIKCFLMYQLRPSCACGLLFFINS